MAEVYPFASYWKLCCGPNPLICFLTRPRESYSVRWTIWPPIFVEVRRLCRSYSNSRAVPFGNLSLRHYRNWSYELVIVLPLGSVMDKRFQPNRSSSPPYGSKDHESERTFPYASYVKVEITPSAFDSWTGRPLRLLSIRVVFPRSSVNDLIVPLGIILC